MSDFIKTAEQLNSEVARLNTERSRLEGMQESAKASYENAIKAYEAKYNVKLDESTLQEEYNKVFAETKGAMLDLQEQMESIKRGDYKVAEEVEFDMEPNVEPIRAEVKETPKKRGRKPKKEVEQTVEVAEPTTVVEQSVKPTVNPIEPMNFGGLGDAVSVEPTQKVSENVVPPTFAEPNADFGVEKKPITPDLISQAVAQAANIKQNPETVGEDDESDEVDISGFNGFSPFGVNPSTEKEVKSEAPADSFSGFGGFGDIEQSGNLGVETKEEASEVPTYGDFGGFGGFGGLSDAKPVEPVKETPKMDEKNSADITSGWGNFGEINFDSLMGNAPKFGE